MSRIVLIISSALYVFLLNTTSVFAQTDSTWKGWQPLRPPVIGFYTNIMADTKRNLYSIQSFGRLGELYQLVDDHWDLIQPPEADHADRIWLTDKEELVLVCDDTYFWMRKGVWKQVRLQDDISRLVAQENSLYSHWHQAPPQPAGYAALDRWVFTGGHYMISGIPVDQPGKTDVLVWNANTWERVGRYPTAVFEKGDDRYEYPGYRTDLFYQDGKIYSYDKREWMQWDTTVITGTSNKTVNMPVPVAPGLNERKARFMIGDAGIFLAGDKIGLRNAAGDTLIRPVFDAITLEESPAVEAEEEVSDYALHVQGGPMDFYVVAQRALFKDSLEGFVSFYNPCTQCDGRGYVPGIMKEQSMEEWVPEKIITETVDRYESKYDAGCRCYVTVLNPIVTTTTRPGYFRKRVEETKTPARRCELCDGGSRAIAVTREEFHYDETTERYFLKERSYFKAVAE